MKSVVSFLLGLVVIPVCLWIYLSWGQPPVATGDAPFPFEKQIVSVPLRARIHREMSAGAPIPASDENLVTGAELYTDKCAECHGIQGEPSAVGKNMFPNAPQLWQKHKSGVVGVSDDPVGETYWKIKNGIRLSGMPAYGKAMTEAQMWQVALLLSRADKPLPAEAAHNVGR